MKPIHEILNQIRWDKDYAKSEFKIGFYDRLEDKIIIVPFRELHFDDSDHFDFQIIDDEGRTHTIPLHRIKELYRDGELIWSRKH